jgi:cytochrome c oxidase subunit 1
MSESLHPTADAQPVRHYINNGSTIASWLFTVDHKRIALMYLVSLLVFFLLGGAAVAFVRLDLMTPAGICCSPRPTTSSSPCTAL